MHRLCVVLALGVSLGMALPVGCRHPRPQAATTTGTAAPAPPPGPDSLVQALGGPEAVSRVLHVLFARLEVNPVLHPFFEGANLPLVERRVLDWLIALDGGPRYQGPDIGRSHVGMHITHEAFDAFIADARATLKSFDIPPAQTAAVAALLESAREDVVQQGTPLEDRVGRLELQLDEVTARLQVLGQQHEDQLPPSPAPRPLPRVEVPPPDQAARMMPWLPEEKDFAAKLIQRYQLASERTSEQARPDLLGQPLEQTRFLDADGQVLDLVDFRGQPVVLVVLRGFAGRVCLHCSTQTIALVEAKDAFEERTAKVVLVFPGEAAAVPTFVKATRALKEGFTLPFPICLDVDLAAVRTFRIEGNLAKPTTLILDEEGLVQWAYVGRQPADRPSARDILAALDALTGSQASEK